MKLFNLNIALKIDNDKEVVDLILKDKYDIVTLQESVRKLDEDVYHIFDTCGYIKIIFLVLYGWVDSVVEMVVLL